MNSGDYYLYEFFSVLEMKVRKWIHLINKYIQMESINLAPTLESYVNYLHFRLRDDYCLLRQNGLSKDAAIEILIKLPLPDKKDKHYFNFTGKLPQHVQKWAEILESFKGQPVYYANITRMASYLIPFIKREKRDAILISDNIIALDSLGIPDNITVMRFPDAKTRVCRNDFLERNFPLFFSYINTIRCLDQCIEPPVFYTVCGCQTQAKIWASICNSRGGESVLFQHGWPAHIHAGFANMPYKKMVLWGKRFKDLWHHRNPLIEYSVGGYPYPVLKTGDHNCITFFLQEPYFVSSTDILNRYYNLIIDTARRNPGLSILYRLHPESDIDSEIRNRLDSGINTYDVSDKPLEDVYSRTKVAVSHYSSTIMECIVHGCIPLVFNPTPNWQYTPDLEAEEIGYISTSEEEFHKKLHSALSTNIPEHKIAEWYEPVSTLPTA